MTNLRDVAFRCGWPRAKWISETLRTARPENLKRLSLELPYRAVIEDSILETIHQEWLDLDGSLVKFWVLHSFCFVIRSPGRGGEALRDNVARFLPELVGRGISDPVL